MCHHWLACKVGYKLKNNLMGTATEHTQNMNPACFSHESISTVEDSFALLVIYSFKQGVSLFYEVSIKYCQIVQNGISKSYGLICD